MGEVSQHAVTFLPAAPSAAQLDVGNRHEQKSAVQDTEQKLQKAVMPFWPVG